MKRVQGVLGAMAAAALMLTMAPDAARAQASWATQLGGDGSVRDAPVAIAMDAGGNVYVTGTTDPTDPPSSGFDVPDNDIVTTKYSGATGAVLWTRTYSRGYDNRPAAIAVDSSGEVIVTGRSSSAEGYDIITLKYDGATGASLWNNGRIPGRLWDGPSGRDDWGADVATDAAGNVYITGATSVPIILSGDDVASATTRFVTLSYSPSGVLRWTRIWNDPTGDFEEGIALAADNSGNIFVTGKTLTNSGDGDDYVTQRYRASDGYPLWFNPARYGAPAGGSDTPVDIAVDNAGGVYITGTSYLGTTGAPTFPVYRGNDYCTIKYSVASGAEQWRRTYGATINFPASNDTAAALALTPDGSGIAVTGSTATLKYATSDGSTLWTAASAPGVDVACAGDGSVFIATPAQHRASKYDGTTGALLWSHYLIQFPIYGQPLPQSASLALAVSPSGTAFIAGTVGAPSDADWMTARYDP